ncbi:hypothetical protein K431DRAFT_274252 [Polychaeton citri CBS 116435]|uniref:WHIM1 domain-containing protein n=1 Tax=Polychaeton citri CBS 116435 TaxID=1314669 RepID=A0A9P4Q3H5_9PEZI|nr:hypothetical protein K431DRAFT_274252 [Polychaeton citri CBS 116435]
MLADDSDSSSLSSAPEDEVKKLAPIFLKAKKATKLAAPPPDVSPPRPKRAPSPPHELVLADNPDIAFLVMFRSRWSDAFPTKLAHLGPQDIERGVVDSRPSDRVESLLCALLGLVLNRKKPVERGHYGRALEEAVATQKSQWPLRWSGRNPLHGGKDFHNMSPSERLDLMRTLALWSLSSSEVIQALIKEAYKQQRHGDDENQPRSVQPWGLDGEKRRYFLVEGQDDTAFRVYRESGRYNKTKECQWIHVAGSIEEVRALANKLESKEYDASQAARRLASRMVVAIPRFEATDEKRKRREYRQMKRQMFTRPEPGSGLYEGRTRGNRPRYNYDDMDDTMEDSDTASYGFRRSARHTGSSRTTPAVEPPTYTASGRQVKARHGGEYGASLLSTQVYSASGSPEVEDQEDEGYHETREGSEDSTVQAAGRATRSGGMNGSTFGGKRKRDPMDEQNGNKRTRHQPEDDDELMDELSEDESAGDWDSDANADADDDLPDAQESDEDDDGDSAERKSLVITLRVTDSAKRSVSPGLSQVPSREQKIEDGDNVNGTAPVTETGRDIKTSNPLSPRSATLSAVIKDGAESEEVGEATSSPVVAPNKAPTSTAPLPNAIYLNNMRTGPGNHIELSSQQSMREERVSAE